MQECITITQDASKKEMCYMAVENILMGKLPPQFGEGGVSQITFCVTEECNLRCKYCYMVNKNNFHRMSISTAKKAVDMLLEQEPTEPAVIFDFIGGEPTLEIELIDKIVDYIKLKLYCSNHPWFDNYRISIGTNGLLYHTEKVQRFIQKNYTHLSVSITIDGTKEKHDLQRVKPDGSGSYDDVIRNIPLWRKQFPGETTKVTFASEDLPFLKDSIIHLWKLGIDIVPANVVFEDVWRDGDAAIFEEQLRNLADYIIENRLWNKCSVRFFDPNVGHPMSRKSKKTNFCGAGQMIAVSPEGKLYPCIRFLDFCVDGNKNINFGSIDSGINTKMRELFTHLNAEILNDGECEVCQIAQGCFSCSGSNYACSETGSIFIRTKYHCEMQKAQARANEYFWNRMLDYVEGVTPYEVSRKDVFMSDGWNVKGAKYLYFLLSNGDYPHCVYTTAKKPTEFMNQAVFDAGMEYARRNGFVPVFLGNPDGLIDGKNRRKLHVEISKYMLGKKANNEVEILIPVFDGINIDELDANEQLEVDPCIYLAYASNLDNLCKDIKQLLKRFVRVNIIKPDVYIWTDAEKALYLNQLRELRNYISNNKQPLERVNIFDISESARETRCLAGSSEYTLGPNGEFYVCPAFYFADEDRTCGSITHGIMVPDAPLYTGKKREQCEACQKYGCKACLYENELESGAINIASKEQCLLRSQEIAIIKG